METSDTFPEVGMSVERTRPPPTLIAMCPWLPPSQKHGAPAGGVRSPACRRLAPRQASSASGYFAPISSQVRVYFRHIPLVQVVVRRALRTASAALEATITRSPPRPA